MSNVVMRRLLVRVVCLWRCRLGWAPRVSPSVRVSTPHPSVSLSFPLLISPPAQNIVTSTITVYNTIVEELLPTPAKPHYTFNLRDLSKVFQGCLMGEPKKVRVLVMCCVVVRVLVM